MAVTSWRFAIHQNLRSSTRSLPNLLPCHTTSRFGDYIRTNEEIPKKMVGAQFIRNRSRTVMFPCYYWCVAFCPIVALCFPLSTCLPWRRGGGEGVRGIESSRLCLLILQQWWNLAIVAMGCPGHAMDVSSQKLTKHHLSIPHIIHFDRATF
jgi:hypothetical protein